MTQALRSRGHQVIEGARGLVDGPAMLQVDFMVPVSPDAWAERLATPRIAALVNCVGILMPAPESDLRAGAQQWSG